MRDKNTKNSILLKGENLEKIYIYKNKVNEHKLFKLNDKDLLKEY